MNVWFEGQGNIDCELQRVQQALEDVGELFVEVVRLMPGLTSVELVEQGADFVAIKTNEGLMKRTNISTHIEDAHIALEFDERYEAGSKVTATSHFSHEFETDGGGVTHRLVMSGVEAPGFLGFFYRSFGSSKTGNAFLAAYKSHLEAST